MQRPFRRLDPRERERERNRWGRSRLQQAEPRRLAVARWWTVGVHPLLVQEDLLSAKWYRQGVLFRCRQVHGRADGVERRLGAVECLGRLVMPRLELGCFQTLGWALGWLVRLLEQEQEQEQEQGLVCCRWGR